MVLEADIRRAYDLEPVATADTSEVVLVARTDVGQFVSSAEVQVVASAVVQSAGSIEVWLVVTSF